MLGEPSSEYVTALGVTIIITSSLSLVFTCVGLLYCGIRKKLHSFDGLIILMLLIGDFIQSTSILIPQIAHYNRITPVGFSDSGECAAQAFFQQLGLLIQMTWSFNIALIAYNQAYSNLQQTTLRMIVYIVGFACPLVLTIIPLSTQSYGASFTQYPDRINPTLCFIIVSTHYKIGDSLMILTFVLPLIIILALNFYLFIKVANWLRISSHGMISNSIYLNLLLYPFILFICQVWFVIFVLIKLFSDVCLFNYQIWCYSISNLCGMLDVLAYGYNFKQLALNSGISMQTSQLTLQKSDMTDKSVEM